MFLASVAAVFGVIVVTLAAFGAGFWIEKRVGPSFSPVESVAFQFLAGLGILSLTLFLSGQIAYTRVTIAGTIVVSAVLGIRSARKLWRESQGNWRLSIGPIPAAVLAGVLAVTAVAGLAEIIGDWENDAIAYHLLGPKVWLRDGIIRPLPDTSTTAFPSTAEVIFGALFKVGGNRAPGLFCCRDPGVFSCGGLFAGKGRGPWGTKELVGSGFRGGDAGSLCGRSFWIHRRAVRDIHTGSGANWIRG
jgi:hypothetical protein